MLEGKRIILTGHSSGGALAILASTWLLENCTKSSTPKLLYPICITFGSPLVGDSTFNHALEREGWSHNFLHFVMSIDIVPRIMLTPLSSYKEEIQTVLSLLSPNASDFGHEIIQRSNVPSFYKTVLKNGLSISSHQACGFMGCTNSLLGTLSSFVDLSPYRPSGTWVFGTSEGQLIVMQNSDAVFQVLFYLMQLNPQEQLSQVTYRSLNEHWQYDSKLKEWIVQNGEVISLLGAEIDANGLDLGSLKLVSTFPIWLIGVLLRIICCCSRFPWRFFLVINLLPFICTLMSHIYFVIMVNDILRQLVDFYTKNSSLLGQYRKRNVSIF